MVLSLAGGTLDSLGRVSAGALAVALVLHVLKVLPLVLAGSGSTATVLGFGLGMQGVLTIVDLVIGGIGMSLVARRVDPLGFLSAARAFSPRPSGGLQAARRTLRS